jgi:cytosine/adenosine deaminase-related metal-dependent hydrolase
MTQSRRQLLTADWVLPVSSPPFERGAVLIDANGRIEAVGPAGSIEVEDVERRDLGRAALLPGLINVHAHPELAAFRGLLDDLPFHEWIPTLKRSKDAAAFSPEDYTASAEWTCNEALRAGVTTIGATEASGAAVGALRTSGMRGIVYLETFGPSAARVSDSIGELRTRLNRLSADADDLVRLGISPHAPYTVSDALFIATAGLAKSEGLPIATHAAEAEAEQLLVRDALGPFAAGLRSRGIATPTRGKSTIELLDRLGVLSCRPLLIHCVRIDADDIRRIADHGASIAHCPVANARLGHGIAPIVEARAAGIRVGIGSDSVASNNRIDLLEEARIAQIVQRTRLQASGALTGAELLRLVTIEAAEALGLQARIGTIESGKDADLCAIALDRAHTTPLGDIVGALFHAARGSDVILTMVQGHTRYSGQSGGAAESALRDRVLQLGERLRHAREAGTSPVAS